MPLLQCLTCGGEIYLDDVTYANYQGRVVCPACRGPQEVIFQKKALVSASLTPDIYAPIRDILAWDIPENILFDLAEATLDLGVRAYKSCVVMCRRCVQAVLLDKNIPDAELAVMIKNANKKKILTDNLFHTATALRFFGNSGAHPLDPELRKVTELQASLSIQVTKEILQDVYPLRPTEEDPALEAQ